MAEQTNNRDMTDQLDRQDLEDRVDQLESTISKMLPGRRDALKLGGAALVGGAAMSGAASAQPGDKDGESGVIGTDNNPVDIEASDIEVDDLVVNQSATGPFGGGGVVLEAGDSITVETISGNNTDNSFVTLYSGPAKDVLGGIVGGHVETDFLYTFSDNSTLHKNGTGTTYTPGNINRVRNEIGDSRTEFDILPPALNVTDIEVGGAPLGNTQLAAEVILKD